MQNGIRFRLNQFDQGSLHQLQHGENHADAYLRSIGRLPVSSRPLEDWPYPEGSRVRLYILAGHRNMEGERAFVQELPAVEPALAV